MLSHKAFTLSLAALACSAGLRGTDSSTPLSEVSSTSGFAAVCPPIGTGDGDARGASFGHVAGSSLSNSSGSILRGPGSWPAALSGSAAYGPGDCSAGCTSSATSRFRRAISAGRSMTSTGSTSSSLSVGHGSGAERPSAPLARAREAALWTLAVGWGPGAPELADAAATPPAQSSTRKSPPRIGPRHAVWCTNLHLGKKQRKHRVHRRDTRTTSRARHSGIARLEAGRVRRSFSSCVWAARAQWVVKRTPKLSTRHGACWLAPAAELRLPPYNHGSFKLLRTPHP